MRVAITLWTLAFIVYSIGPLLGDEGVKEEKIFEERGWMSNRAIRNKFTKRYMMIKDLTERIQKIENAGVEDVNTLNTKVSQMESDLSTLKDNQEYVDATLYRTCERLDALLDKVNPFMSFLNYDCCKKGYEVKCVMRAILSDPKYTFPSANAGDCVECPDAVLSDF